MLDVARQYVSKSVLNVMINYTLMVLLTCNMTRFY